VSYFFGNKIQTAISDPVLHAIFCYAFYTKVFEHANITRWRRCNADSLKTLKANWMLIRLSCVQNMTKYVGKILL